MSKYKYYRAEINGKGIFHILSALEDAMEEEEAPVLDRITLDQVERTLEEHLPCPHFERGVATESWFTELGFRKARHLLDTIGKYAEEYLPGDVTYEIREEEKTGKVYYLDKYQVIFVKEGIV